MDAVMDEGVLAEACLLPWGCSTHSHEERSRGRELEINQGLIAHVHRDEREHASVCQQHHSGGRPNQKRLLYL